MIIGSLLLIALGVLILLVDEQYYSDMNEKVEQAAEQRKINKYIAEGESNTEGIVFTNLVHKSDEEYLPEFVTYSDGEVDDMHVRQKMKKIEAYENVITIPSLGIKAPVIEATDEKSLWKGACRYDASAKVGDYGNCVLAGHGSQTYKYVFSNLPKIEQYADVHLWDADGKEYIYTVIETATIYPSDRSYLYSNDMSAKYLTLFTCVNHGTQRFVVRCKLFEAESDLGIYNEKLMNSDIDVLEPIKQYEVPAVEAYFTKLYGGT